MHTILGMGTKLYQVDAFTRTPWAGNAAGVVTDADGLTPRQMQAVARELNNSETAFVLRPDAPDHDVRVRFFTPTMEVPTCGHATVAAHYVRAVELGLPTTRVRQRIGIGTLPVDVVREGDDYRIIMTQGPVEICPPLRAAHRAAVLAALGVTPADLDERCPVQIVGTGAAKVLVGLAGRARLHALRPHLAALVRLASTVPNCGVFVFTLDAEPHVTAHARMFAPHLGIPEDPVTGNGNGPLGAYLVHHRLVPVNGRTASLRARQGEAMGRPGTAHIWVDVESGEPRAVRVGGDAVIAFRGTLGW